MSRSGYVDDCENHWDLIRWRGAVESAIRGKRGQTFLRELRDALDAMPAKRLITEELQEPNWDVCAIGALGVARGVDMEKLDPEDPDGVAKAFAVAPALVKEVSYENDEAHWGEETPEQRWTRMRAWVDRQIARDD